MHYKGIRECVNLKVDQVLEVSSKVILLRQPEAYCISCSCLYHVALLTAFSSDHQGPVLYKTKMDFGTALYVWRIHWQHVRAGMLLSSL